MTVFVRIVAAELEGVAVWVFSLPPPPFVARLVTGLHLFALPSSA